MPPFSLYLDKNNNINILSVQKFTLYLLLVVVLIGCGDSRFDVPLSEVDTPVDFIRIDQELVATDDLKAQHQQLLNDHQDIYGEYFSNILALGDPNTGESVQYIREFLKDPTMSQVQVEIDAKWPTPFPYESKFEDAIKRYSYWFKEEPVPAVVYYNSGLNYGVYPRDHFVGVGLDWYMGKENEMVKRLPPAQFPQYIRDKMEGEYMVTDAMRGWLQVKYSPLIGGERLLDIMVYLGKITYLTQVLLPDEEDYLIYGYTPSQAEWCEDYEFDVWRTLVKEDLLFSKNQKIIKGFTGNGPYTKGFSEDSPGRIGFYMGHQMVIDFMNGCDDCTLQDLMNTPADNIMRAYKPN